MYSAYKKYQCPYLYNQYNAYRMYPYLYYNNTPWYNSDFPNQFTNQYIPFADEMQYGFRSDNGGYTKDYGPEPFVINIDEATTQNNNFRTALWTGNNLQVTLMNIKVGEDIGLEIHPNVDQFIRIEEGEALVKMGDNKCNLDFQRKVYDDFAILIPAGKWHNIINTGDTPLKLYSIYAPPQHPRGTIHETKAIAQAAEENQDDLYKKGKRAYRQIKEFTLSELAEYDGTMGKPAYVAVNGIVYDVSDIPKWSGGIHYDLTAGNDLTLQFVSCHGMESKLANLPKVGVLKE